MGCSPSQRPADYESVGSCASIGNSSWAGPWTYARSSVGRYTAIDYAGTLIAFLTVLLIVQPLALLLHELGHALAALQVSTGPVEVVVGGSSPAVEIQLKRLKIYFSLVPCSPRTGTSGFCRWNPEGGSALDQILICLAGPYVSALLIGVFILAAFACAGLPDWVSTIWILSAIWTTISLLMCFDPRPGRRREPKFATSLVRDIPRAMAAYRQWREESRSSVQQ